MSNSQNSQTEEVEVSEIISPSQETLNATFNQQNNYHLTQNIDLDKLSNLSESSSELAKRVMSLYEKQQEHNIGIDKRI